MSGGNKNPQQIRREKPNISFNHKVFEGKINTFKKSNLSIIESPEKIYPYINTEKINMNINEVINNSNFPNQNLIKNNSQNNKNKFEELDKAANAIMDKYKNLYKSHQKNYIKIDNHEKNKTNLNDSIETLQASLNTVNYNNNNSNAKLLNINEENIDYLKRKNKENEKKISILNKEKTSLINSIKNILNKFNLLKEFKKKSSMSLM